MSSPIRCTSRSPIDGTHPVVSYRSLETILRYDLDKVAVQRAELAGVGNHSNIRGPEYYRSAEVRPC